MKITNIEAYEIIASNGLPTIEVRLTLDSGTIGIASVPYGSSTGSYESTVLLDREPRYNGKGARKAIANVLEKILPALKDSKVDALMLKLDGTQNKINLGGNAILSVSLAYAKAVAQEENIPLYEYFRKSFGIKDSISLPHPMMVAIEGGRHAFKSTDLQEYCLTGETEEGPTESIRKCLETYYVLGEILQSKGISTNVGHEGAYAPDGLESNETPLKLITQAIEKSGHKPKEDIGIMLDAAASEFFKNGQYFLTLENKRFNSKELIKYYEPWLHTYPIVCIEDMLHEDDWDAWTELTELAKKHKVENIADDLTATNLIRLQKAIDLEASSAILIKFSQAGTVTETIETCLLAKKHNMMTVPSHRGGGETNDSSMIDLAVAVGSKYIKVGPTRGERVSKYNRLMEIERDLAR